MKITAPTEQDKAMFPLSSGKLLWVAKGRDVIALYNVAEEAPEENTGLYIFHNNGASLFMTKNAIPLGEMPFCVEWLVRRCDSEEFESLDWWRKMGAVDDMG